MVTVKPLACSNLARDAARIPFPREDVTPPVTKMYFVLLLLLADIQFLKNCRQKYWKIATWAPVYWQSTSSFAQTFTISHSASFNRKGRLTIPTEPSVVHYLAATHNMVRAKPPFCACLRAVIAAFGSERLRVDLLGLSHLFCFILWLIDPYVKSMNFCIKF